MDPLAAEILDNLDRGGTIGVGYLGVVFSSLIYGITCIQTFQYFNSPKGRSDRAYLRVFVILVWILDTFHQALVIHSHYTYLVTGWGNVESLLFLVWTIPGSIMVNSCVFILVRAFFLRRIWLLSQSLIVTVGLGLLAIARFVFSFVYASQIASHHLIVQAETTSKTVGIYALAFEVATTVLYTATLVYYLYKGRSGIKKTDSIVAKVIKLIVSTSMLSAIVAIADLIAYTVRPTKLYNLFFEFILETVDANAALTSLNLREFVSGAKSNAGGTSDTIHFNSIPLSTFQANSSTNPGGRGPHTEGTSYESTMSLGVEKGSPYVV
ncbi:hypothetical protein OH76DRAFT_324658 [Lentinus brumalis]|uniref:DUF6534 domain-containing protein n=1 Tax=Lentinus brumalis TaxID=2498619 RepID=A0A371DFL2_9APHY|nr:hypothetical protein OH76DRAFT_324658 [Polyporus brumalis]